MSGIQTPNFCHKIKTFQLSTEGTGLETVTSLLSVDLLVGKIPNISGASLTNFGEKFGHFFRRTSFSASTPEDISTSPAEEAISGMT